MIDYQRVVEFLRDYRATPGQPVTDEVRRYATEYAQHCAQANERLRQCSVFLQQGLTSEAIHLAGDTPNLLELVSALDLPDAQGWTEFCNGNDLPVPPPLQMERAARLNDAYSQEQPLEELLRQHRRLALSHATVKDRLGVMRELAAADATSGFWEKDLRTFEKARIKELRISFATAMERRDAKVLAVLSDEVLKTAWVEAPGPDLMAAAQNTEDRIRLMNADTKLRKLLGEIRAAFAAKDYGQCADLLQQIPEIVAATNQPGVSTETAGELKPIIAWVKQEDELLARNDESAKAQRRLDEALDVNAPDEQLESLYEKVRSFETALPQELEERYQQTVKRRHRAVQRKHQMILAGVLAGLMLIGGGGYWYTRAGLAAGWAERIRQAVVARNVGLARQLVDDQEHRAPQFNTSPEVASAKQEAAQLEKEFDADRLALGQLLAALDHAQQTAQTTLSAPDAHIADLLDTARSADQELQRAHAADHLKWADADKKLPAAVLHLQNQTAQLYEGADKKARAQVDDLGNQTDQLAAGAAAPQSLRALNTMGESLNSLRSISSLSKDTNDAIAALGDKLTAKRAALGNGMEQAQQSLALRLKPSSVDGWKKALQAYVSAFPNAPQVADFNKAIELLDGTAAGEALADVEQSWSEQYEVTSENVARARLEKLKAYTAANPRSPFKPAVDDYMNYLQQGADAMSLKGSWQQGFHELLSSPLITDLQFLTASNGNRYYVMGDIKKKTQQVGDKEWISFEAIDPANLAHRKTITLTPPVTLTSDEPTPAPHTRFAQTVAAQLKQVSPDSWDSFGITLVDEIARERDIDPVVRSIILNQALQTTSQIVGWGLSDIYGPATRDLARQEVENIVWYDPARPVSDVTIAALNHIADSLPKPEIALKSLRENKAKLFANVASHFPATGALMRDDSGAWTIFAVGNVDPGSSALAAGPLPAAPDQPAPLLRIAVFENGKWTVDESAVRDLPEGTFVFIKK